MPDTKYAHVIFAISFLDCKQCFILYSNTINTIHIKCHFIYIKFIYNVRIRDKMRESSMLSYIKSAKPHNIFQPASAYINRVNYKD